MARKTKRMSIREQMGSTVKTVKPKRKRKPMTDEQKAAASERLAKARAARLEKQGGPKNVHPDVLKLNDEDPLSAKSVRDWIKTQKELLSTARAEVRSDVKGAAARVSSSEAYIRNLERYIREGVYVDMFYGEYQQSRVRYKSFAYAYDKAGNIKRSYGVFYPDLGGVYISDGKIERDGVIEDINND